MARFSSLAFFSLLTASACAWVLLIRSCCSSSVDLPPNEAPMSNSAGALDADDPDFVEQRRPELSPMTSVLD